MRGRETCLFFYSAQHLFVNNKFIIWYTFRSIFVENIIYYEVITEGIRYLKTFPVNWEKKKKKVAEIRLNVIDYILILKHIVENTIYYEVITEGISCLRNVSNEMGGGTSCKIQLNVIKSIRMSSLMRKRNQTKIRKWFITYLNKMWCLLWI